MQKLIALLFVAVFNVSATDRDIAQAVVLMELCKNDVVTCDVLLQSNIDNIVFFVEFEDPELMAQMFSIPHTGCLKDVTTGEVRSHLQLKYRDLQYAKLGVSQMVLNSVMAAASSRCQGQAI